MQVLGSIYQIANDSKEARAGLKIILTSSLTLPEQQSHAERIGAKGFISSLAAPVTIVNAIKAVSEGSAVFHKEENISQLFKSFVMVLTVVLIIHYLQEKLMFFVVLLKQ